MDQDTVRNSRPKSQGYSLPLHAVEEGEEADLDSQGHRNRDLVLLLLQRNSAS